MHNLFLYSLAAVSALTFLSVGVPISSTQTFPPSPVGYHRSTSDDHIEAQAGGGALPRSEFSGVVQLALSGDLAVVDSQPAPEFDLSGTLLNGSSDSAPSKLLDESETADSLNAARLDSYLAPETSGDTAMHNLNGILSGF